MERRVKRRSLTGVPTMEPQDYESRHADISRQAAAEGIVLLKNEGNLLPIAQGTKLALYGAGAARTVKGGTGSGDVNERHSVTVWEGLRNAGYPITSEAWLRDYEAVYHAARLAFKEEILRKYEQDGRRDFFTAYSTTRFELPVGGDATATEAQTAIYVLARTAGENADRIAGKGDYELSDGEHRLLSQICALYPHVIVLINAGGVVDLSFLDEFPQIEAALYIAQPGMEGGNAVADVLGGKVVPSGRLTDTWALRYADYPNAATFSHNNGDVSREVYGEGIYVGYRYFDSFGVPVRYGFGYGLSYTRFVQACTDIRAGEDGKVAITVDVTNAGDTWSGRDVVQVYVSLPEGEMEKEYRRLCAFAKTRVLAPAQKERLELTFEAEALASYEEKTAQWVLEPGVYGIFVGGSLEDGRLVGSLNLAERKVIAQARNVCPVQTAIEELSLAAGLRQERYAALLEACRHVPSIRWALCGVQTATYDYDAARETEQDEATRIAGRLTRAQQIAMVTGNPAMREGSALGSAGVCVPGSAGETSACALAQGVANIALADGPAGLRLNQYYDVRDGVAQMLPFEAGLEKGFLYDAPPVSGARYYQYCTAIPVGTMLAQTWDTELLTTLGRMVGEEMERFGVTLWLAPGMNIHRNPLCGRNFEYYAEDPLLSGRMAAAMTRGVQSRRGCGTTIKHFACNNQEDNRLHCDSVVSERALREIYLRGFGIAIREAQPLAMMTSYNLVNGVHAANSYDLCTRVARCEFGFQGLIMTDWTTTEHGEDCTAARCIQSGNDLIMPGQLSDHESIRGALERGELEAQALNACVTRIIRVILQSNCYE